jgi:hypothetical protein
MNEPSPLDQWLKGKDDYVSFVDLADEVVDMAKGVLVVIEQRRRVHETLDIGKSVFPKAWTRVRQYLGHVEKALGSRKTKLEPADVQKLTDAKLDAPPPWSLPLYFMSICKPGTHDPAKEEQSKKLVAEHGEFAEIIPEPDEKLVYVGQKAKGDRFRGGHAAITKLTHPKYDGWEKWIYEARVTIQTKNGKRIPLEWVQDKAEANLLLHCVEHQLIYQFKPELNDLGVKKLLGKWQTNIGLANFCNDSKFLHGRYQFWGVEVPADFIPKINVV